MTVRVSCPNPGCGAVAGVEEQSLGKRGRCQKCGHVFALVRPDGDDASAASDWKRGAEASGPIELPEQFGRYRIMKKLGQGGMGAVYLAIDTRLQREIALKVPFFAPSDGPQVVQRFEREARAAATLDHPNLCPIHDVGEIGGIHYLTMPYIKGKPLSEAIGPDQAVTETQAAAIALKLAQALQEAHDKGVVHRDLKPGNIMVNRRRDLIVMDFGLARMVGGDDGNLTRTGNVLGTALYMAPEQAAGDVNAIGPTVDVYSLGVILYELLTGRRPFEGPWSLVIGLKNVKDPDPPSGHRTDLSPALDAICRKAIARESVDRYPSMADFARDLEGFLKSTSASAQAPPGMPHPVENSESLTGGIFAGIVMEGVSSLREVKSVPSRAVERAGGRPPGRRIVLGIVGAAGFAAALLLGVVHVSTDEGRIRIVVNDPKAVIKIDGKEVLIDGLGESITLRAGEHDFQVKRGDGEFRTRKFVVRRGETEELKIEYEPQPAKTVSPKTTRPKDEAGRGPTDELEKANLTKSEGEKDSNGVAKPLPEVATTAGQEGVSPGPGAAMGAEKADPTELAKGERADVGPGPESKDKSVASTNRPKASPRNGRNAPRNRAPDDAIAFDGNRYKVFHEVLTWIEARNACEAMGGHLVIIKGEDENRFVTSLLSAEGVQVGWLGATDEVVEGRWVWIDGTEMRYENWDLEQGQPTNKSTTGVTEQYLVTRVDRDGAWCDVPNDAEPVLARPGFVCEWGDEAPRPSIKRKAIGKVPADARSFGNNRWKVFPARLSWHQARIRCEELGGRLAVVKRDDENRFVRTLLAAEGLPNAWLGATDERVEGRWVWSDGSDLKYQNWANLQPTNRGYYSIVEHYLMMTKDGQWNDVPHQSLQGFVCQWD